MEAIRIVGPAKPRMLSPAEWRERALSRRTDADRANDVIRLKADAIVAMNNIDRALAAGSRQQHATPETRSQLIHGSYTSWLQYCANEAP